MASVAISLGSAPQSFPGYPTQERDDTGAWIHTERYWVKNSAMIHSVPAYLATKNQAGVTVTDPDGNTLKCRHARIEPGPSATDTKTVELTYSRTETKLTLKRPVDNPRSVRLVYEDIPIDDERLLVANGGIFTAQKIIDSKIAGYKSFPLYGIEYTYTELDASFAWTEAAIVASVQSTGSPPGMGSPTAGLWELIGKEIDETDSQAVIREHWRYAKAGFVPIKV